MQSVIRSAAAAIGLCVTALASPTLAAGSGPVVVELFTSQGCSSCPPADRLLGELAAREDVLPLSFHVTYWDRLGWPDTFGMEANTERQEAYAHNLGRWSLYTPQMVIGGRVDVVGSGRDRVLEAIALLRDNAEPGPEITVEQGQLRLGAGSQGDATVWLVAYDPAHDVEIRRGENAGNTFRYHNVVRAIDQLADWHGKPLEVALPQTGASGVGQAILVQRQSDGAIIAAKRLGPVS